VRSLRRARQQLSGFLLRQGCHYGRPAWTKLHRRWLAGLKFEQAVHHIVLEDYIAAVEAAEARRDRLTAQIEAMLPDWTLVPVVAALQTMRGMALVNAATLVAELGDLSRFANPRQLRAYLGLVPSEHSSGAGTRRGGLTKAGNSAARRLLIEAAWTYYFPARLGRELLPWQEEQPTPIREIAWKATAQTVHALSQARPHRQARQCRHRRDRPRAGRLCLGHRPVRAAGGGLTGAPARDDSQGRRQQTNRHATAGHCRGRGRGQENPRIHYLPGHRSDAGP